MLLSTTISPSRVERAKSQINFLLSAIAVVVVIAVIIAIAERRDLCAQPRDGEVPDLERPAGIDRGLRAGKGQIEREIRSVDEFAVKAESWARRKQQAARRAIVGNAVEIAELGDDFAARIDHHDLVLLVGIDPEIVIGVDRDAVGRVNTGGEERGRSRRAVAVHRDLDDVVISGVGYEHRRTRPVELDPVGAERRVEVCAGHEQRIGRDPLAQAIAILVGPPDDALERIRDVDIACPVKADRVGAGTGTERGDECRRVGHRIPFEDAAIAEIGDEGEAVRRVESDAQHRWDGSGQRQGADEMTRRVEHPERRRAGHEAISIEAATRYIDISVEADGEAFSAFGHARRVIRQHRESIDMAAIPRRGGSYPTDQQ
jgi:hypothetical protein